MYFRDLSFWGIFKVSLILDFLIPLLLTPFVLIYYLAAPEKFTFNWEPKLEMNWAFMKITSSDMSVGMTVMNALFIGFIGLLIQCAILNLLAQKTPAGRIKLGK